jgi:antitoxin MazE
VETLVKRWGNSLALRIPKVLADGVGLRDGSAVELTLVDGKLVILPVVADEPTLEDLLALVTEANLHSELDTGPARGGEQW